MPTTRFVLALLIVAPLAACARRDSESGRRFELTGTVAGRESSSARLMIAHDAIDGLMPAMNMPFEVRGAARSLREGDRIAATLVVTRAQSWLENVRVTAAGSAVRDDVVTASHAAPGIVVPAFPLVNQDGQSLTLRDYVGRVLVITFVYTRCPLPDFCPLMVKHLESVRRKASEEHFGDRVALLGQPGPGIRHARSSQGLWRIDAEEGRPVRPVDAGNGDRRAGRSCCPVLRRSRPRGRRARYSHARDSRDRSRQPNHANIPIQFLAA